LSPHGAPLTFPHAPPPEQIPSTIGVDFKIKLLRNIGGKTVKATIWDTAGQERFRTLTSSYYRGAHGIIMVYDVTRPETFEHLTAWLTEIEMYSPGGGKSVVKLLVGNKADLTNDRAVSTADGEAWARSKGMLFLETSAMDATNVNQAFTELTAKILDSPALIANTQPSSRAGSMRLDAPRPPAVEQASGGCC